jgi:hypothetical protein
MKSTLSFYRKRFTGHDMTEQEIAELRSRIAEVEDDFSRRANILLDESLLTRDQADSNTKAITT